MRIFLDTNVLVSAFAARGLCAEVLELVLLDHDLIVGRNVLRELERALRAKVKLPVVRSAEIVDFVSGEATQVVDNAEPANVAVDTADAFVLVRRSPATPTCSSPAMLRCCGSRQLARSRSFRLASFGRFFVLAPCSTFPSFESAWRRSGLECPALPFLLTHA